MLSPHPQTTCMSHIDSRCSNPCVLSMPNQTCLSLPSSERFSLQLLYVLPEMGGMGWFKACLVISDLETGKDRDAFLGSDASPDKCLPAAPDSKRLLQVRSDCDKYVTERTS